MSQTFDIPMADESTEVLEYVGFVSEAATAIFTTDTLIGQTLLRIRMT